MSPAAQPEKMRANAGNIVACTLLLGALSGASAYWQLFTTFRFWDDEGYMIVSLGNFAAGGKLYSEVFSQYGPAYNLFFAGLHRFLGVPLDTAGARWVALVSWVAATLVAAGLFRRLTGSWWWAFAAAGLTFAQLRLLTHEPLHPVDLVAFLLMAGTAAALLLLAAGRRSFAFVVAAASGVVLALVKINVGMFYLAGLSIFALWSTCSPAARPLARLALTVLAILAGVVLMHLLIADPWVQEFLAVYVVASATTLVVLAIDIKADARRSESLVPLAVAALVTLATILVLSLAAGVSPPQLWDGIIRGPLLQPVNFSYAFRWSGLTLPVLGLNAAGCAIHLLLRSRSAFWATLLVAVFRLVVALGFLISFFHGFAVSVEGYLLSFGTGFLWALAAPLGTPSPARDPIRQLLAALALFQVLHAFPVAGTQVNLGTLPLALLILFSLHEIAVWAAGMGYRRVPLMFVFFAVAFPLWSCARLTAESARNYFRQPPEEFSGAHMHLSPWQTSTLATLTENARRHGDMLFSLPGMFSFNVWTQLPTPNGFNSTQWWSFLNVSRQRDIAARLDCDPRPVIIVQRNLISAGLFAHIFSHTLLTRFIDERFVKIFALDSYEFWVRRGREVLPVGIARWNVPSADGAFSFYTLAQKMPAVSRVEFLNYQNPALATLPDPTSFSVAISSIADNRLTKWVCTCVTSSGFRRDSCDAARFFAADGRLLAEARFERPLPQANPQ